ncbi:MAG: TatD family hydrolase [Bacteroidales bacterium]|jgi:TatD DNase family protein
MNYIDTHSHIYSNDFESDRDEVVEKCIKSDVNKIILPNIDLMSIQNLKNTILKYNNIYGKIMFGAMGLHPTSVTENYKEDLETIKKELYKGDYIAIGEIGMDLYWDKSLQHLQEESLKIQLNWAKELNLPVLIHSRNAEDNIIEILENNEYSEIRGVFHCWSGSLEQTKKILDLGFYIGVGGTVTFNNSNVPNILKEVPINRILTETDSPYLSPMPYRGKRNNSSNIPIIVNRISDVLNIEKELLIEIISDNVNKLLNI